MSSMNGIGWREMRPNGRPVNPGTIYSTEWAGLKLLPPTSPNGRPVNPGTIYSTEWAGLKLLPPTSSFAPIIIL